MCSVIARPIPRPAPVTNTEGMVSPFLLVLVGVAAQPIIYG